MKKHLPELVLPADFVRIFGVSRRTAKRYTALLDPLWTGWRISGGRLYDDISDDLRG